MYRKKVFLVLLIAGMAMVLATGSAFGGEKKGKKSEVSVGMLMGASRIYGSIKDYIGDNYKIIYVTGYEECTKDKTENGLTSLAFKLVHDANDWCKQAATTLGYSHVYYAFDHYQDTSQWPYGGSNSKLCIRANIVCLVRSW